MASQIKPGPMPPKPEKQSKKQWKGLRPVSDKKAAWLEQYHAAVKERMALQKSHNGGMTYCEKCLANTPNLEPHHPWGRIGDRILKFKLLGNNFSRCQCHSRIHQNPNQARKEGWLHDE